MNSKQVVKKLISETQMNFELILSNNNSNSNSNSEKQQLFLNVGFSRNVIL